HRRPGTHLCVLEREQDAGLHQSGHNSGVLHRGVYYAPGSLKARLCVEGAEAMERYCEARGIALEHCGKLIVALSEAELPRLNDLERRSRANGVPGLRRLSGPELREVEPHAAGVAALHSPRTGIVDYPAVVRALRADVEAAGATVATGCEVTGVTAAGGRLQLSHSRGVIRAAGAVACAGLWSDRLAVAAGGRADPRIVPFRGGYLRLRQSARELVRGLVYPVPDPDLPFLGVHLSRHVSGDVLIGPTALLAPARDAYRLSPGAVRPGDVWQTATWPGALRMAARFWRTGVDELLMAASRRRFIAAAARYVPELRAGDVIAGPAGIRAQAVGRDGALVDDFVFHRTARMLHVRNAPSPGATSSLAIARHVADEAEVALGLEPLPRTHAPEEAS
ncbi:MAG TPA: L-2-hydroxyglutarate oxidase, partial [Mycobacteriales bacterium]|nr:L-2-hydroxyglutarate oxidase [Mycobacteriales bacterium]